MIAGCKAVYTREPAGIFRDKFGVFGEVGLGGMYPVFLGLTFKLK